jgi:hypothetical protein
LRFPFGVATPILQPLLFLDSLLPLYLHYEFLPRHLHQTFQWVDSGTFSSKGYCPSSTLLPLFEKRIVHLLHYQTTANLTIILPDILHSSLTLTPSTSRYQYRDLQECTVIIIVLEVQTSARYQRLNIDGYFVVCQVTYHCPYNL